MTDFNLEHLVNSYNQGEIRGFEFFIDRPHHGQPAHIDLHVFKHEENGVKYTGLGGVDQLRQDVGFPLPYNQSMDQNNFR